jgi:hypothetical protein
VRVDFVAADPVREPRLWVPREQVLGLVLRPGSIEIGVRRTELTEFRYVAGEMILPNRHEGKWIGLMNAPYLELGISDSALMAASGRTNGAVELPTYRKFADSRLGALAMRTTLRPSLRRSISKMSLWSAVFRLPQLRCRVVNGIMQLSCVRQHEKHPRDVFHVYQRQHSVRSEWDLNRGIARQWLEDLGTPRRSRLLNPRSDYSRNAK